MAPHERWTFADYADLAATSGAPALAQFFLSCGRGTIPRRIPKNVSPAVVAALVQTLAEHRHLEISEVSAGDDDGLLADYGPDPTPWEYYGPYGGHPSLPTALHGVCLAACDECAPDRVWEIRPPHRREEKLLWIEADGHDEIYEYALYGYPRLPPPAVLIARRNAPFLPPDLTETSFWAVGVAFEEVLLGLTALVVPSRAGTMIVRRWQAEHPYLIGHNIRGGAESYWQKQGFVPIACPLTIPPGCRPLTIMAWQAASEVVIGRMEELGLPWWEKHGASRTSELGAS